MDSFRIRSSSGRSTPFETDHNHLEFLIPRISRKYRSLSFDSGLRLIVSLSGNQRIDSPTRLVMSSSVPNSDRKIVTGPAGYVLEDVPHFTDDFPNSPVRLWLYYFNFKWYMWVLIMRAGKVWNFTWLCFKVTFFNYPLRFFSDLIDYVVSCDVMFQTYPNPLQDNAAYSVVK